MGFGSKHFDRLLPRHLAEDRLEIEWHVRDTRVGLFKKEETSDPAIICDLSLEGALLEVPGAPENQPGDTVRVRFDGINGDAIVRHRLEPEGDQTDVRFGVHFRHDSALVNHIGEIVGLMRDARTKSNTGIAWEQAR